MLRSKYAPLFAYVCLGILFFFVFENSQEKYYQVSSEIVLIYYLDFFLGFSFSIFIILFFYKALLRNYISLESDITHLLSGWKVLIVYFFVFILILMNYEVLIFTFFEGLKKEEFLQLFNYSYTFYLISPVLLLVFSVLIINGFRGFYPAFILFVLFIVATQNKTIFLQFFYFVFILVWLRKTELIKKKYVYFFLFLLLLSGFLPFFQGRVSSVADGLFYNLDALARYKVYGLYLSDNLFNLKVSLENTLLSILGFFSEKITVMFFENDDYIVTGGFIGQFHEIGPANKANAIYPWSIFLYSQIGLLGLGLKFLFLFLIFIVLLSFRLRATLTYFIVILFFIQMWRHPFLMTSDFYAFLGFVILDFYILTSIFFRKGRNCESLSLNKRPRAL